MMTINIAPKFQPAALSLLDLNTGIYRAELVIGGDTILLIKTASSVLGIITNGECTGVDRIWQIPSSQAEITKIKNVRCLRLLSISAEEV